MDIELINKKTTTTLGVLTLCVIAAVFTMFPIGTRLWGYKGPENNGGAKNDTDTLGLYKQFTDTVAQNTFNALDTTQQIK